MHRLASRGAALAAALLLAGCGAPKTQVAAAPKASAAVSVQAAPVATSSVAIQDFDFKPAAITVLAGTTVTWTNKDVEQHTVTARDKSFNSDAIAGDKTFSVTSDKAGSYEYFCQIHPHMVGTVVVTNA